MICEQTEHCDGQDSDGGPCRHFEPHDEDSGCSAGCANKSPFGAVCIEEVPDDPACRGGNWSGSAPSRRPGLRTKQEDDR